MDLIFATNPREIGDDSGEDTRIDSGGESESVSDNDTIEDPEVIYGLPPSVQRIFNRERELEEERVRFRNAPHFWDLPVNFSPADIH
jgi:hypothetical protein